MLASGVAGSRGQWVASALFLAGFLPSQSLSLSVRGPGKSRPMFDHFWVEQKESFTFPQIPGIDSLWTIHLSLNQPCSPGEEPAPLESDG